MANKNILIVDDDPVMRDSLKETLKRKKGFTITIACDGEEALRKIKEDSFDLIITDLKMPKMNGLDLVKNIKSMSSEVTVIVMTAYGTVETAVTAMKEGAFDYLTKPFSIDELETVVEKAFEHNKLKEENQYLRDEIGYEYNYGNIIGESFVMKQLYEVINKVAKTDATILIQGESGTGKELVARAIHYNSLRNKGAFIKLNCTAISSGLLESELFGHEKGSFTNAFYKKAGRFELADKGTLLLDEISEMEPSLQAKLLRVIQEGEFDRVGGTVTVKTDVRIIATTNKNLLEEIKNGKFREDLYYRLNVIPIFVKPLRQRKEDIPILINYFVNKFNAKNGKSIRGLSPDALRLLVDYDWPGNVRELQNAIERAIVLTSSDRLEKELFAFIHTDPNLARDFGNRGLDVNIAGNLTASAFGFNLASGKNLPPLSEIEKKAIFEALSICGGNKTKVAEILGITTRTLRNKLKLFKAENAQS